MSDKKPVEHRRTLAPTLKDKAALFAAHVPSLKNGGTRTPTHNICETFIPLSQINDSGKFPVDGNVVWMHGCRGSRQQGTGIQLGISKNRINLRNKTEGCLGSATKSSRPTHTM